MPMAVRDAYDAWAATYDAQDNDTRDLDAAVLREAGLPFEGEMVVELGPGTGKNTRYFAAHARSVLALDLSPGMLARARELVLDAHVSFVEHDITLPWPVASGRAGIVAGNLVLEHVADLRPVFVEGCRVLRPGGLMFVCELHPYRQLRGVQARFRSGQEWVPVEAYPHTVAEYVNTALASGFELVRLDEWQDGSCGPLPASAGEPRLLSLLFRRPGA
jgi:malonyl-CoA O-methyltransferase